MKKIKLSFGIRHIFCLRELNVIGLWSSEKEIILCSDIKLQASSDVSLKKVGAFSTVHPVVCGCNILFLPSSNIAKQLNITVGKDGVTAADSLHTKDLPSHVVAFTKWGDTWYYVIKFEGGFKVQEHGPTSFGLRYAQCLNKFYEAISYIPPHGFQSARRLTITESIELASDLSTL